MDVWPQRTRFRERLRAYQDATGKTQAQAAEDLGVELSSLRFWLYQKKRKPSMPTLQKAAALFQCSVMEFMDDPGAMIGGQSAAGLSPKRRFLASMFFDALTSEDLTDEDAQYLYEDFLAARDRLTNMRNKMRGNKI